MESPNCLSPEHPRQELSILQATQVSWTFTRSDVWHPDSAGDLPTNLLEKTRVSRCRCPLSWATFYSDTLLSILSPLLAKATASTSGQDPAPLTFSQNLNYQLTLPSPECQTLPFLRSLLLTMKHSQDSLVFKKKKKKKGPSFGVFIPLSYSPCPGPTQPRLHVQVVCTHCLHP